MNHVRSRLSQQQWRQQMERAFTTHGTATEYRNGCRCVQCVVAKKQANHGYFNMTETPRCVIPSCTRPQALAMKRGLCMPCYSKAKKLIESGTTWTWDILVEKGLAIDTEPDPFTAAVNKLTKGDWDGGD